MPYAQAAGAGASSGSNSGSLSKDKFCDEKMVVCLIKGFAYEQLAEELNKTGSWKAVLGYQKVDFNGRIAMVVKDPEIRTFLVEKCFNVNGVHVFFSYHKRRVDLKTRVHISQLPIGITPLQGRRIDTGDRVLIVKQIHHHMPSCVFVRGWRAFVKYACQPQYL